MMSIPEGGRLTNESATGRIEIKGRDRCCDFFVRHGAPQPPEFA